MIRGNRVRTATVCFTLLAGAAIMGAQQPYRGPMGPRSKFKVNIAAYSDGGDIPKKNSCEDPNATSPAVQWSDPPMGTVSFAVIFHDMEGAPRKGSMDVTHWIFWNAAATSTGIAEGVKPDTSPDGIVQGKNVLGFNGYHEPCAPPGATPHHYAFEIYALDTKLDLAAGASREDLLKAMDGHVIGKAAYVGFFGW